jgi:hypothetical protein
LRKKCLRTYTTTTTTTTTTTYNNIQIHTTIMLYAKWKQHKARWERDKVGGGGCGMWCVCVCGGGEHKMEGGTNRRNDVFFSEKRIGKKQRFWGGYGSEKTKFLGRIRIGKNKVFGPDSDRKKQSFWGWEGGGRGIQFLIFCLF